MSWASVLHFVIAEGARRAFAQFHGIGNLAILRFGTEISINQEPLDKRRLRRLRPYHRMLWLFPQAAPMMISSPRHGTTRAYWGQLVCRVNADCQRRSTCAWELPYLQKPPQRPVKDGDGRAFNRELIRLRKTVHLKGGETFMTAYLPASMVKP